MKREPLSVFSAPDALTDEIDRLRAALTTVAQAAVDAEANGDAKSTLAEIYRHVMAALAAKGE